MESIPSPRPQPPVRLFRPPPHLPVRVLRSPCLSRATPVIVIRFASKLLPHRQWFLLHRRCAEVPESLADFVPLFPPRPGSSWADPFPVEREGRQYVFFEEVSADSTPRRGRICLMELDENGLPAIIKPIIEQPYHISYPFVFEADGEWYLVPESRQNRTVDLYRCTRWPDQWRLERTLLADVERVDPTLHYAGERWWLFAGAPETPGGSSQRLLYLYSAKYLHSPVWTPHPLNPVVVGAAHSRPAGRLFADGQGRLIRPAQDCSVRYGYGISLNHVTELTPETYAETPIQHFAPQSDQLGTHTFNRTASSIWIDACRQLP